MSAEAQGVGQGVVDVLLHRSVKHIVQIAFRVGDAGIGGSGYKAFLQGLGADNSFDTAGSAQHVAGEGLGGADHHFVGRFFTKCLLDGNGFVFFV